MSLTDAKVWRSPASVASIGTPSDQSAGSIHSLARDPGFARRMWLFQGIFWSGLCIITFLTLTLWDDHAGWMQVSHTLLQGGLGVIFSLPLMWLFRFTWDTPMGIRVALLLVSVIVVAALWNGARMATFIWITAEPELWSEFGDWYFGALLVFLCWSTVYHGLSFYQLLQLEHSMFLEQEAAAQAELLKRMRAEGVARDAQLRMLRYQINPHFLFNTLNSINSLVRINEAKKAQRMIVQLSDFLRYSLDQNPDLKVALQMEIRALMLYLDIQKTRFGERLTVELNIDEQARAATVPSLLLQPLVENSIKYAISSSEAGGKITIAATVEGGILQLSVRDTGSDADQAASKLKRGRGIGLRNTVDRLKASYGEDYALDFELLQPSGLVIHIRIPYQTDDGSAQFVAEQRER